MAAAVPNLQMNNGKTIPVLGFGAYFGAPKDFTDETVKTSIGSAIDAGYRHIDTAWLYRTEAAIGKAIKAKIEDGTVKREDLFITSKLHFIHHDPAQVQSLVEESIRDLDCGYLDLYLMHSPWAVDKVIEGEPPKFILSKTNDNVKTYKALEECVKKGLIRSIGISNFNARQTQRILDNCEIKPVMNQVEIHPYLSNIEIVKYCQDRGVAVTAFTPLGQPHSSWAPAGWVSPLQNPVIKDIGAKYNKSPGQVALKFLLQRDIVVIAKAQGAKRQKENIDIFDFTLSDSDMEALLALNKNARANTFEPFKEQKDYPFHEPY